MFKYSPIILTVVSVLSLFLSIYESTFREDMLHSEKMFVEASQFLSGLIPYKEVFIMYGYLTTVLQAFSLILFGNYILSVSIITGIIYALTFPIFFLIFKNLRIKKELAILSVIIIFFIHPHIILPWSAYIAYFFLLIGTYYITKINLLKKDFFFVGLSWSLASLSRQIYFTPLFLCILIIIFSKFFLRKKNSTFIKNEISIKIESFFLLLGFFLPILIFIFYLIYNKIYIYWYYFTFDIVENVLKSVFFSFKNDDSFSFIIFNLIKPYKDFFLAKDLKSFFYLLIIFFNFLILGIFFIKKKFNLKIFYISILSLLMLSQIVQHIDLFRLSTGTIVGFVPIIFYFKDNKIFKKFLYFFLFLLIFSSTYYMYHSFKLRKSYVNVDSIAFFRFQKLPKDFANFYEDFSNTIIDLKNDYIINKNFNYTPFPMLSFLSRTRSHQIGTYNDNTVMNFYLKKPEFIKLYSSLQNYDDIIIFIQSSDKEIININFEQNFFIYKSFYFPYFEGEYVQLLIPKKIKKNIGY